MNWIGRHVRDHSGHVHVVAVEGLYVPRHRAKAVSVVALAEATGELLGPLRQLGTVLRPTWQVWAKAELGLTSGMGSDRCEGLVIQEARRRLTWTGGWPAERPGPALTMAEELAIAEAAFIAHWAGRGQ